ncbi:hypothetical protein PI124_g16325 [Phytophthora idaei]|nr:hypothetical protein PI124_g16325 [Phytophthora idaei]
MCAGMPPGCVRCARDEGTRPAATKQVAGTREFPPTARSVSAWSVSSWRAMDHTTKYEINPRDGATTPTHTQAFAAINRPQRVVSVSTPYGGRRENRRVEATAPAGVRALQSGQYQTALGGPSAATDAADAV